MKIKALGTKEEKASLFMELMKHGCFSDQPDVFVIHSSVERKIRKLSLKYEILTSGNPYTEMVALQTGINMEKKE